VGFADFWPGFDPHDNFFIRLLSQRHQVEVSASPDILLYSVYGDDHTRYSCKRILVSFENRGWGFSRCDFAITSDLLDHPDHFRLPLWSIWHGNEWSGPSAGICEQPISTSGTRHGFASIVVTNPHGSTRNRVHRRLESYRPVASGGRHLNNVGGPVANKIEFLSHYKFNIAFENSSYPGYTTEKILDALVANTVPIYWGDPQVGTDFNSRRIVSLHDFASEEEMVRHVIALDHDDDAYAAVLAEPWFPNGAAPACTSRPALANWFDRAIADERTPVARRRSPLHTVRRLEDRMRIRHRYRHRVM
jgi:hypothetical protein